MQLILLSLFDNFTDNRHVLAQVGFEPNLTKLNRIKLTTRHTSWHHKVSHLFGHCCLLPPPELCRLNIVISIFMEHLFYSELLAGTDD